VSIFWPRSFGRKGAILRQQPNLREPLPATRRASWGARRFFVRPQRTCSSLESSTALALFRKYREIDSEGGAARDAEIQIGEILFNKTRQYEAAIQHYRKWLREHPGDPLNPEFLYRIGKAQFYLWQFEDAIQTLENVGTQAPGSKWEAAALHQAGMAHLALAGQSQDAPGRRSGEEEDDEAPAVGQKERYQRAIQLFQKIVQRFPATGAAQEAQLALATAYEELSLWSEALAALEPLATSYPTPQVIRIRQTRIRERLARQNPPLKRKG
jgi:TolA-binding protein